MPAYAPPVVLVFSVTDPTAAGGLLADVLTCAAMGCYAAGVVTSVSVQDSARRQDVQVLDDEWVDDQARAVLEDMAVAAFKVGAVGSVQNAQAIAEILSDYDDLPVVLDPVFELAGDDDAQVASASELMVAARELLLPQATVLTLDLGTARRIVMQESASSEETNLDPTNDEPSASTCARQLLQWGAEYVLLTGVRTAAGMNVNSLFGPGADQSFTQQNESIEHVDQRFRGAGDTLSAAIASLLAQGIDVADAVREAHDFLGQTLAAGFRLGMGAATPDRMFWAPDDGEKGDDA